MTIKARTTRTENDLADFANENNIPRSSLDHTVNSSGMLTVFYADAYSEHGAVVFGTDGTTGAAIGGANYAAAVAASAYSSAINVANSSELVLYITVVDVSGASGTLDIYVRSSNLATPDVDTATDWYTQLSEVKPTGNGTHKVYPYHLQVQAADLVAANKVTMAVAVTHATWSSLVFVGDVNYEITVIAEPVA